MAGLAKEIADVYIKNANLPEDADTKPIEDLAKGLAIAIDNYIKDLKFNITNLDAVVQLDEIQLLKPISVDLNQAGFIPFPGGVPGPVAPLMNPLTQAGPAKATINVQTLKFGSDMVAKGRAYLGKKAAQHVKITDQKYNRTDERDISTAAVSLDPNSRNV